MAELKAASVAVIGAGPTGLSVLKTLREDGFNVTLFERRSRVGGLWSYTDDKTMTSALPTTEANISKYTCGFTDFPIPDSYPPFMTQEDFQDYMELYSRHFDLYRSIVFKASVNNVIRNETDKKWQVQMTVNGEPESRQFDKVVFAHGYQTKKKMPQFEGQKKFEGQILHAQEFRRGEDFKGQNVVIVGMSATAGDVAALVSKQAAKLYISHRRGAWILSRYRKGLPVDLQITHFRRQVALLLQRLAPNLHSRLTEVGLRFVMRQYGKIDPSFRIAEDVVPISLSLVICMDSILELFREGKATSMHGIKRFLGGKRVEFTDGTVLENVDAVVCCTGYAADLGISPFLETSKPKFDGSEDFYKGPSMPRLYMNIFPPKYHDSIAVLTTSTYGKSNGFSFADVVSMAISNIWRGVSQLPPRAEQERWVDEHQSWLAHRWLKENTTDLAATRQWEYQGFLHAAAGTGMENLGWGWQGWWTWLRAPRMTYLMNHGVETAHAFRYFETGKRKTWDGAQEAIIRVNDTVKRLKPDLSKTPVKV